MKVKYKLEKSTHQENWWVLTDTENRIVVRFEDGKFNETQQVTPLDNLNTLDYDRLPTIMRELGEWVVKYHSSKAFKYTYGFEYDKDETLVLYRRKPIKWRMRLDFSDTGKGIESLPEILREAANYIETDFISNK